MRLIPVTDWCAASQFELEQERQQLLPIAERAHALRLDDAKFARAYEAGSFDDLANEFEASVRNNNIAAGSSLDASPRRDGAPGDAAALAPTSAGAGAAAEKTDSVVAELRAAVEELSAKLDAADTRQLVAVAKATAEAKEVILMMQKNHARELEEAEERVDRATRDAPTNAEVSALRRKAEGLEVVVRLQNDKLVAAHKNLANAADAAATKRTHDLLTAEVTRLKALVVQLEREVDEYRKVGLCVPCTSSGECCHGCLAALWARRLVASVRWSLRPLAH